MKKIMVSIACLMMGFVCTASSFADTNIVPIAEGYSATVEAPVLSAFVSRGRVFEDGAVFQPNATVMKDFGYGVSGLVNVFGNISGAENHGDTLNETDITIGGSAKNGDTTITFGDIEYLYAGKDINNTREGYFGLAYSGWYVNPNATIYADMQEVRGIYTFIGINHTYRLGGKIDAIIDTGLGLGSNCYNDYNFGYKRAKVNDWASGLTINYYIAKNTTISTGVRYSDLLDRGLEEHAETFNDGGDMFVGKLSFIRNF